MIDQTLNVIRYNINDNKKSVWLYDLSQKCVYFFFCLHGVRNHEIALEVGNFSTRGDEVVLNAEKRRVLWRSPDFPESACNFVSFYGKGLLEVRCSYDYPSSHERLDEYGTPRTERMNTGVNTMDGLSTFSTKVNSSGVYVLIMKDRLAIAIRSLKDRCVTSVSLTQMLV